ncbi:MAG TPA: hypothetical protein VKA32_10460 [Gammaproteobacteria bacterium]|nr:hypothetical protein [Gammaproteobacteria bacterium]
MDMIHYLQSEHGSIRSALDVLERELTRFEEDGAADLECMHDALYYLNHHPALASHSMEAPIYERLAERDRTYADRIRELNRTREALVETGEHLLEQLEDMAEDVLVPKDVFDDSAHRYIDGQRAQVETEDHELLPRAAELFRPADWREFAAAVRRGTPPPPPV